MKMRIYDLNLLTLPAVLLPAAASALSPLFLLNGRADCPARFGVGDSGIANILLLETIAITKGVPDVDAVVLVAPLFVLLSPLVAPATIGDFGT